ncbi:hypothetical protein DI53_1717 [Sphingobacterium deserti]|uniref:Uncharacterized protein n=1 Tax=Sphingobacterium deserti TaxID=1229276 RepID=A0A0B8T4H5_9SPHI|nr:hypothetical protein DI53_1717 [Sphingobacterium deserti]
MGHFVYNGLIIPRTPVRGMIKLPSHPAAVDGEDSAMHVVGST